MPGPRLLDVAEAAACSVATVSRVLSAGRSAELISPDTQWRVEQAAARLGYRPNYHARALKQGRAQAIGLVFDPPAADARRSAFTADQLAGIDDAVRAAEQQLVVIGGRHDGPDALEQGLAYLAEGRIDGLLVPARLAGAGRLVELSTDGLPVVVLREAGQAPIADDRGPSSVELDVAAGLAEAAGHLAGLGHRRVLWCGPERGHEDGDRRRAAWHELCTDYHLACEDLHIHTPPGHDPETAVRVAHDAIHPRLAADRGWTAIMCYHDQMALGALAACHDLGVRVPADCAIIGFDDVYAATAWPALSSVGAGNQAIGAAAVELLLARVADPAAAIEHRRVPTRLIPRTSTAATTDERSHDAPPHRGRRD